MATYDDVVVIMNRNDVSNRQPAGGTARANLEGKLQTAFVGKSVKPVKSTLEKMDYACQVYRPRSVFLREYLTGSLERGILWCNKKVHWSTQPVNVELDNKGNFEKVIIESLQKDLEDLLKELLSQENVFVRYENGRVVQVAVR